jgi:hypothetical protein
MPAKPSKKLMIALRDFVFRHEIFVEAREFDDGFLFTRRPATRSKRLGARRHFRVSLRRDRRRVHFYSISCGSDDAGRHQVPIDFPETALLRPAEAAIEYETCGRKLNRYVARFPKDTDAGRALFGYVRSESRLLEKLLGDEPYRELLGLVRRHGRQRKPKRRDVRR